MNNLTIVRSNLLWDMIQNKIDILLKLSWCFVDRHGKESFFLLVVVVVVVVVAVLMECVLLAR